MIGRQARGERKPVPLVFDSQARSYDSWYDSANGRAIFAAELGALRPLVRGLPLPRLEVCIGTGRFALALGFEFGIDTAQEALPFAQRRMIHVARGNGQQLPFPDRSMGTVAFITALSFFEHPLDALREARRVIRPDGGVVIGDIPADGPWGRHYRDLAHEGHPYYQLAHFLTRRELTQLLADAGFHTTRIRTTLFSAPTEPLTDTSSREGDDLAAGFLATLAQPVWPERVTPTLIGSTM